MTEHEPTSAAATLEVATLAPKSPIWRSPGFWIAAFFVLLITMNVVFFYIAGTNPVEFTTK